MSKAKSAQQLLNGFQIVVRTTQEWEQVQQMKGLVIVDLHCSWCGPCAAIVPTLKRLHQVLVQAGFEINFAVADDRIEDIKKKYTITSEPTFLFVSDGKPKDTVVGANVPRILRTVSRYVPNDALVSFQQAQLPSEEPTNQAPPTHTSSNESSAHHHHPNEHEASHHSNAHPHPHAHPHAHPHSSHEHESHATHHHHQEHNAEGASTKDHTPPHSPKASHGMKKSTSGTLLDRSRPVGGVSNTFVFVDKNPSPRSSNSPPDPSKKHSKLHKHSPK